MKYIFEYRRIAMRFLVQWRIFYQRRQGDREPERLYRSRSD